MTEIEKLEIQLEAKHALSVNLIKENKELRTRVAELTASNKVLRESVDGYIASYKFVEQEFASAKKEKDELQNRLSTLEAENKKLSSRDGNAKIQLCYNEGVNPFAKEDLKVVDFGVSDNIYIVKSKRLSTLLKASEGMEKALEEIIIVTERPRENGDAQVVKDIARASLADFRAVKETMKKGA